MKHFGLIAVVLLALSGLSLAQTATPTPTPTSTPTPPPGTLTEGLYRFMDLSAPSLSLAGTWVVDGATLRADANGATATIPVQGQWVLISAFNYASETYEVCFATATCTTYSVTNTAYPGIGIPIPNGMATLTIRKLSGARLRLDRLWIMQGHVSVLPSSGGATPAPAPSPYVMFVPVVATAMPNDLSNPVISATLATGQTTTFELSATAGDVHLANLLTATLLSMWAFFLIWAIALWRRK